ncbi:MAG: SUMF1/EgtB/PvdO family nonheme iron enzyme [Limisphaerales bacterium]
MNRRSQVGRHDLLRCLQAMPEAPVSWLAQLCQLDPLPDQPPESTPPKTGGFTLPPPGPVTVPPPPPASPSNLELLWPVTARSRDPATTTDPGQPRLQCEILLEQGQAITDAELSPREIPLPPTPPLQPWARLWPYLRRALGCLRDSRRLNIRPLLRQLAAHRAVTRLPCLRYPGWSERVTLIWDRRRDLLPFWGDMESVLAGVAAQHGAEGLETIPLDSGQPPAELPRSGGPVLVLSDLGCLAEAPALSQAWAAYGRRLRRAGLRPSALLSCPRERWHEDLAQVWACACWDRGQALPRGARGQRPLPADAEAERAQRADGLLNLLAPALRVEPGLLRAIRLLLPPAQADVGTEYDAWHHPHTVNDASAMGVRAAHADTRRAELRDRVPVEVKAPLAALLSAWHQGCSETIRTAETLHLAEAGVLPANAEIVAEARAMQNRAAARLLELARQGRAKDCVAQGFLSWQQRGLARSSDTARQREEFLLVGWAVFRSLSGAMAAEVPKEFDAETLAQVQRLLQADPGRETLWEVRQACADLLVQPAAAPAQSSAAGKTPPQLLTGVPLAWLRARRFQFYLEIQPASGPPASFDFFSREARNLRHRIGQPRRLVLSSDCGEVTLEARPKPKWASRFGQDQAGLFAEFELDGARFRLRWIPPGGFLMGSPESEAGRYADEPLHRVTISRGFWLADTPCTQEQWQAVMGENPSEFKEPYEPKRPVESVDWEQCRQFFARLRKRIPDLDFRLPTEAEWEYACRAGTTSAFNDGSDCTVPEGKDPALERIGWHGEGSEGKTHPVAVKPPNAWGLRDMHGNVWEWCADQAGLEGSEIVVDTNVDGIVDPHCEQGAWRVVRGGSYWNESRLCRSACRGAREPGIRLWILGFRLAAGQELGRGAPSPSGGRRGAPVPESPAGRPGAKAEMTNDK